MIIITSLWVLFPSSRLFLQIKIMYVTTYFAVIANHKDNFNVFNDGYSQFKKGCPLQTLNSKP
jgi:hypothetical protein